MTKLQAQGVGLFSSIVSTWDQQYITIDTRMPKFLQLAFGISEVYDKNLKPQGRSN